MRNSKYYIITGLMALIFSPIITSFFFVYIPVILLILIWCLYARTDGMPERASEALLPVLFAFSYYMLVWLIIFGLSGYSYRNNIFGFIFLFTLPYSVIHIFLQIGGNYAALLFINAAVNAIIVITVILTRIICKKKLIFDKKLLVYGLVIIGLCSVSAFQFYDRSAKILNRDYNAEHVSEEVDLRMYHPFSDNGALKRLDEPASVTISENYPRLDGATAAYPVYSAMAQELYDGLDAETAAKYVYCTTTATAYERLINGEIDIFFGARPSKQQLQAAAEKNIELKLTPIAKEAFVFFVNSDNPVNGLTVSQIQDIYSKKITNWRKLGGKNERILAFQRPENSGSQTIMLAAVMGDTPLPPPIIEEYSLLMGGMISDVAAYRNYSSAIGYSFKYYATGMNPNDNIKLIAVNGIGPSAENIKNGIYPFTVDVYAVTAVFGDTVSDNIGSDNENIQILIDWILSEQGQEFIEKCGYTRVGE